MDVIPKKNASDIFKKGFLEPYLRAGDKPFIKLLNWYTGFGKTYTAADFAIDLHVHCDVIPVFIAPLQSIVAGFEGEIRKHKKSREYADDIEDAAQKRDISISVFRLYSIEYHLNDRNFFSAVLSMARWLDRHQDVFAKLEAAGKKSDKAKSFAARFAEMRKKSATCKDSQFFDLEPSDDTYEDSKAAYLKAANRVFSIANGIIRQIVMMDVNARSSDISSQSYMAAPEIAEMVRRLCPLQAFLDNPGIIVCTASKAQTGQEVFAFDETKGKMLWRKFINLPLFLEELNRDGSQLGRLVSKRPDSARVVTFVDEEEDSYWFLFDQRKSVVNPEGRNDLNIVITEFFTYFDLKWPLAFEGRIGSGISLASKVYEHLEDFADIAKRVDERFGEEKTRTSAKFIPDRRRVEIYSQTLAEIYPKTAKYFDNAELLQILQQLHDKNDDHHDFKKFRQKASVLAKMRAYINSVRLEKTSSYETFRHVCSLVCDKKYFTMNRSTYGEVLDQPGQTFFNDTASVMDTDFLRQIELLPDTAHQTVRLRYHEQEAAGDAFTLLHYLEFVLFIARTLSESSGDDVIEFTKDDIERYRHLSHFRNDVRQLFKDRISSEGLDDSSNGDELLTDSFFFDKTKSVVTLEESRRQADEYNISADVSLTVTITSLRATPEEDIVKALGRTNGVYIMSATGGLETSSSGAFNTKQLRRSLHAINGNFDEMSGEEIEIVSAEAHRLLGKRDRHTVILDDSSPEAGFEVSANYRGLLNQFNSAMPQNGEVGFERLNRHKKNEIVGLVSSLDKLLSSSMRSGLVLCQTVKHIQKALIKLAKSDSGLIEQKDTAGNHFVIHANLLPAYRKAGCTENITLILYNGPRFRRKDSTKIGALQEPDDSGQFSQDLEDALDVSESKVLLWSAYKSASRGINFLTRQDGTERDFELFCLLNDPYYTRHTRTASRGFSMEMFQSFAQVVRDENDDWAGMTRNDLLFQYSRNRWRRLRKEHFIDIARTIFQSLGRGERRPNERMSQNIYVSSEVARMLHLGIRHAAALRERASPAQRAVLSAIDAKNQLAAIFHNDQERKLDTANSLKLARAFRDFTSSLPKRFRSDPAARTTWTSLFDESMFKRPLSYLEKLNTLNVPTAFRDACYRYVPSSADVYTKEVSLAGITESVITDAFDGTDTYDWTGMIAPDGLVACMSARSRSLLNAWEGFDGGHAEKNKKMFPQPWFVTEIMKGYIAELEFEQYIEAQFGVSAHHLQLGGAQLKYIDIVEHPLYAELYQMYDYYLELGNDTIAAIDIKNWARSTDRLKREELQAQAIEKHARIRALLPDQVVHAFYVNLYGAHKHAIVNAPSSGSIQFMSLYVSSTNPFGISSWIPNENLANALSR